jgi:hypothetical protein
MELVLMELDVGAELDGTECAKVVDVELVGGMDLGSGRDRQMEHERNGRRESRQLAAGAGERCRRSPSRE